MLELKRFQQQNPDGCTVTRLSQLLNWRGTDTNTIVDDLVQSGMVYGDYLTPWVRTHPSGSKIPKTGNYLVKVSPWGDEFLKHWEELDKLSVGKTITIQKRISKEPIPAQVQIIELVDMLAGGLA